MQSDILIIGGGPAGLTAAIYARRANRSVLVLEKAVPGGQITASARVDNYPAVFGLPGLELADRMAGQAKALGAQLRGEAAESLIPGVPHRVITAAGTYTADAVILATGMRYRTLGLPGEDNLSGISYCAACDGAFYRGKSVAVCGGGNTALQDALFLSDLCGHVMLIHRRDSFRGDPILVEALKQRKNVTFCLDTVVTALEGQDGALRALVLENRRDGRVTRLEVEGLFEAIGHLPDTGIARSLGITDEAGFLLAGEDCRTALSGIFAAGDCRVKPVRQLITACADGAVAALQACGAIPEA